MSSQIKTDRTFWGTVSSICTKYCLNRCKKKKNRESTFRTEHIPFSDHNHSTRQSDSLTWQPSKQDWTEADSDTSAERKKYYTSKRRVNASTWRSSQI